MGKEGLAQDAPSFRLINYISEYYFYNYPALVIITVTGNG